MSLHGWFIHSPNAYWAHVLTTEWLFGTLVFFLSALADMLKMVPGAGEGTLDRSWAGGCRTVPTVWPCNPMHIHTTRRLCDARGSMQMSFSPTALASFIFPSLSISLPTSFCCSSDLNCCPSISQHPGPYNYKKPRRSNLPQSPLLPVSQYTMPKGGNSQCILVNDCELNHGWFLLWLETDDRW